MDPDLRREPMKLLAAAALVLSVLAGAGLLTLRSMSRPTTTSSPSPRATAGATIPVPAGATPGSAAGGTLRTVAVTAAGPPLGEVMIQLDEASLMEELNTNLAGRPLSGTPLGTATLRDLVVRLRNGQMLINGQAQIGGASVPIAITGTVEAQAGGARARVFDIRVGGFPLPESARQQVEQFVQEHVDRAMASQPLRVRSVRVADGRVTVIGAHP